jgi:catecholate siderophore receptor
MKITQKGIGPLGALLLAGAAPLAIPVAAQEAPRELPTVSVQADADKPDGYRATATRVGKVLQDPHDIPQAVTTLTGALLEEQQVGSLKEALRNVSGLSFNAAEGGRSGDNMNLRGFYTFGDMYLDGIRDTAQYNRETFNYEQIDVLRGAGAMLFGRGQAGGVINQVSKTPLRIEQYKLTGSIGDYGYRELTADINKPLRPTARRCASTPCSATKAVGAPTRPPAPNPRSTARASPSAWRSTSAATTASGSTTTF